MDIKFHCGNGMAPLENVFTHYERHKQTQNGFLYLMKQCFDFSDLHTLPKSTTGPHT